MTFQIASSAFGPGDTIPLQYTGDGLDISPPLSWVDPPSGTRSFALICDDPDASGKVWVHWVIFNLPVDQRALDPGIAKVGRLEGGITQGKNDFGELGYGGPAPPKGKRHRYFFKLYALDTLLSLPAGATKHQMSEAMKGHILAETHLVGIYER